MMDPAHPTALPAPAPRPPRTGFGIRMIAQPIDQLVPVAVAWRLADWLRAQDEAVPPRLSDMA